MLYKLRYNQPFLFLHELHIEQKWGGGRWTAIKFLLHQSSKVFSLLLVYSFCHLVYFISSIVLTSLQTHIQYIQFGNCMWVTAQYLYTKTEHKYLKKDQQTKLDTQGHQQAGQGHLYTNKHMYKMCMQQHLRTVNLDFKLRAGLNISMYNEGQQSHLHQYNLKNAM